MNYRISAGVKPELIDQFPSVLMKGATLIVAPVNLEQVNTFLERYPITKFRWINVSEEEPSGSRRA